MSENASLWALSELLENHERPESLPYLQAIKLDWQFHECWQEIQDSWVKGKTLLFIAQQAA